MEESSQPPYPIQENLIKKRKPFLTISLVILIILLGTGGGLLYAYKNNLWPFHRVADFGPDFINKVLERVGKIETASYKIAFSLQSAEREEGRKSLSIEFSEYEESQAAYDRDKRRFSDLGDASYKLDNFYFAARPSKHYPLSLEEAKITIKDPRGVAYEYTRIDNGDNFNLKIKFETDDAIKALNSDNSFSDSTPPTPPLVNGKTVTFDKDSPSYFYFSATPEKPWLVELLDNQEELSFLPGNLMISVGASGIIQKEKENADSRLQLEAELEYEDMTMKGDGEFIKKGDTYYVKINKLPGFFALALGDFSKIKGQWVKITPDDVSSMLSGYISVDALESAEKDKGNDVASQLMLCLKVAGETNLFTAEKPTEETLESQKVYHYQLKLNNNNIVGFYEQVANKLAAQYGDKALIKPDESALVFLKSPSFAEFAEYLNQNTKIDLFVEAASGYPVKLIYEFRLIPDEKVAKLEGREFILTTSLVFGDINKSVTIATPEDSITQEDAVIMMTGVTKEEYRFGKQYNNISSIKSAIVTYNRLTGEYPDSLDELKMTGGDIMKAKNIGEKGASGAEKTHNAYYVNLYKDKPLLKTVPKDVFSGKDYVYEKTESDYKLKYEMKLPPYKKGTMPAYTVYKTDYSTSHNLYSLRFIEGTNTMTSKNESEETISQAKIDSDDDGLVNNFEIYLGTNKDKKDTDGDGFTDGEEIYRMTDPSGPGKLERASSRYYPF